MGRIGTRAPGDGVKCADDRKAGSKAVLAESVALAGRMFRGPGKGPSEEEWPEGWAADLRRFAIEVLERHLKGSWLRRGCCSRASIYSASGVR